MKGIDFLFWLKGFLDGMPTDDLRFEIIKTELKATIDILNKPPAIFTTGCVLENYEKENIRNEGIKQNRK